MSNNDDVGQPGPFTALSMAVKNAVQPRPLLTDPNMQYRNPPQPRIATPAFVECVQYAIGGQLPETSDFSYLRLGQLPVLCSLNPLGAVMEYGDRMPWATQPQYGVYDFFARCYNSTPSSPLSGFDTGAEGDASPTITAPAAASAATQGSHYLVPAFVIEMSIDLDIPPATVDLAITGTLEDGTAWSHTGIQLQQKGMGMSQFLVIPTKAVQQRAFPCPAVLQTDWKVVLGGVAIALTAGVAPNDATSITPTNGIKYADANVTFAFTNVPTGMTFRVQTCAPTSRYANVALAVYEASLAAGGLL